MGFTYTERSESEEIRGMAVAARRRPVRVTRRMTDVQKDNMSTRKYPTRFYES